MERSTTDATVLLAHPRENTSQQQQMANPSHSTTHIDSTVEEIQQRMKELELRYLGTDGSDKSQSESPFKPINTLRKRIEAFRPKDPQQIAVQTKLPPLPLPIFDGADLEAVLKEFERWMRLSGVHHSSDSMKLDWLVQACVPKVRKIVNVIDFGSPCPPGEGSLPRHCSLGQFCARWPFGPIRQI